ncbi:MAG TPA: hypothetical protein VFV50_03075 [Bdellovibrionales bacterium]|nr:hypothetical protein [Bdellovibrionales bacterium]
MEGLTSRLLFVAALLAAFSPHSSFARSKTSSSLDLVEFKLTRNGFLGRQDIQTLKCPKRSGSCVYKRLVNDEVIGKATLKRADVEASVRRVAQASGARAGSDLKDNVLFKWELQASGSRSAGGFSRGKVSEREKNLARAILELEADLWRREAR